ncbi:hypothetical protein Pcinc_029569 [Petrolisthes cinctipes]|uniref:LolA-like domain-containing protein n=1 Tax=Petrolisthes cinctipes TaxID=88211 RepID=A0AAE1F0K9_PETCI|nr:hypothetical protein Pcinc_029569 [Petrolisthes cinctipes]
MCSPGCLNLMAPTMPWHPAQSLLFGDDYKYSWVNNDSQREIPCNRWDACITTTGNDTLQVEYQWSDPTRTFDMFGYTNERPVSARVRGQVYPSQGSTIPFDFDTIYNFALFDDAPTDQDLNWAFQMWYDYNRKLSRLDSIPALGSQEAQVAGPVEVAIVSDFTSGVEYVIDKTLGNCTALPIGPGWDTIPTPDGSSFTITNPLVLFGLGEADNLTYYGTKYARQMPCDVWVGHLDFSYENGTIEDAYIYEYTSYSGAEVGYEGLYPEPVLIKIQQYVTESVLPSLLTIDLKQNIFKFEERSPDMDVFDITPCFTGHDHIRRFQMAFPGNFRDTYDKNPDYFMSEVQSQLAMQLVIPVIRVQHMMIEYSETDGRLYSEFTLLDVPDVDSVNLPAVGPPLDEVVVELQHAVSTYFVVVIYDSDFDNPGHIQLMVAYNDSLVEMFEDECHPLKQQQQEPRQHNQFTSQHLTPRERQAVVAGNGGKKTKIHGKHQGKVQKRWKESATTSGKDRQGEAEDKRSAKEPIEEVGVNQDSQQQPWYLEALYSLVYGTRQRDQQYPQSYYLGMTRGSSPTYSPGAMAGMGVGMFLTGLLLGCVIMMVSLRHFGLTGNPEMIPLSASKFGGGGGGHRVVL